MTRLRLAAHIHTDASDDSTWPLDRLARQLRPLGFTGMLVCDHERTMTEASRRDLVRRCAAYTAATGFVVVPGVEYQDGTNTVHVSAYGDVPLLATEAPTAELLESAHGRGAATVLGHPGRRDAWRAFDASWVPYLSAIEVWNRKYDGVTPNRWALRTAREHGIAPFVSLDFHGRRQLFPLVVTMREPVGDPVAHVVTELRAARFTASAWALRAERFGRQPLSTLSAALERTRATAAPMVRDLERHLARGAR